MGMNIQKRPKERKGSKKQKTPETEIEGRDREEG